MPQSRPVKWLAPMYVVGLICSSFVVHGALSTEYKSGIPWPEPRVVDPGPVGGPPADATVLFNGTDLSQWINGEKWKIQDGYCIPQETNITTRQSFGSCQLHVEWATPAVVEGEGQGRGNSGIFLMDKYEVQVLDSYNNKTYFDGQAGSLYKQRPPLVNVCRKPGEWQTYDIIFKAPCFNEYGDVCTPAYITVLQNGVLVQNNTELLGSTFYDKPPAYEPHASKMPIRLQFHRDAVRFRNIWIRELNDNDGLPPAQPVAVDYFDPNNFSQ